MTQNPWFQANHNYLARGIAEVQSVLERYHERDGQELDRYLQLPEWRNEFPEDNPPALIQMAQTFGLSRFEVAALLLAAAAMLEGGVAHLVAQINKGTSLPTVRMLLNVLPDPSWDAFAPGASLRYWQLLDFQGETYLSGTPVVIDERILNHILGINHFDVRLRGRIDPIALFEEPVPSHLDLVRHIAGTWLRDTDTDHAPIMQLTGAEYAAKRTIAAVAGYQLDVPVYALSGTAFPSHPDERELLKLRWRRETLLTPSALFADLDDVEEPERRAAVLRFVEDLSGYIFISAATRLQRRFKPMVIVEVSKPTPAEQGILWRELGASDMLRPDEIRRLTAHFDMDAAAIRTVCAETLGTWRDDSGIPLFVAVWDTCRAQARASFGDLAQRIEAMARWEHLQLPEEQKDVLGHIVGQVRHRAFVYEDWGFADRGTRGLGMTVLFSGPSGTGKTMAAEVLAHELRMDLYRIDLSTIINKYIGETEKNLRRVFDAAEAGGCILLFDEADALFGKRTEVSDSRDRYANIEVSYLLQKLESFRGLAILTSNFRESVDQAFLRRFRYTVTFPYPDHQQRVRLWKQIFPEETQVGNLDWDGLARMNLAGGDIRNIALNAAFLAAARDSEVTMEHIHMAASLEYTKQEKTLAGTEARAFKNDRSGA